MCSFRWQVRNRFSRRQITSILLIAASIAALLPIPFMTIRSVNGKDRSQPFPCQDRPCGCRSAAQCKKKCCCFSDAQKVAWAKRNGVDPSEVVAGKSEKPKAETFASKKPCCSSKHVAKTPTAIGSTSTSKTMAEARYKIVIGVIAQDCQGLAQTASGQYVFVVPPTTSLTPMIETTGERFIHEPTQFVQSFADPPVPPPRVVAVSSLS